MSQEVDESPDESRSNNDEIGIRIAHVEHLVGRLVRQRRPWQATSGKRTLSRSGDVEVTKAQKPAAES